MYYPGPGSHWFWHNGITRGVLEEGQQNFSTVDAATEWLHKREHWLPIVYTRDGLVIGWAKNLDREQLSVEVWQLCVAHRKPAQLPNSSDARIVLSTPSRCFGAA
jgi:hypothetical protein